MLIVLLLGFFTKLCHKRGRENCFAILVVVDIIVGIGGIAMFPALVLQAIFFSIGYGIAVLVK